MRVPRKLNIDECTRCREACAGEVWALTRWKLSGRKKEKKETISFCGLLCLIEHFELKERMLDKLDALLRKEKSELYKRVCPACVRRFLDLE